VSSPIALAELQGLLAGGAQLVEVLPEAEYEEMHLPGAVNVPLAELTAESVAELDRERPLVVYCWDSL
jgi:phage shock protein E